LSIHEIDSQGSGSIVDECIGDLLVVATALATVSTLIDAGPEMAGVGGSIPSLATI
jgi:hypothetical protein